MSNTDPTTFLDDLQTDIEAVLKNTPGLIDAVVSYQDDADIEQKVARQLAPIKGSTTAKPGLAVIVLPPEVSSAESNLPGPPMVVRVEVQCIEHNVINRSAQGTRIPASGAAVRALNALHHRSLGENRFLYAAPNDPITPVRVRPGYTSFAAVLELRAPGVAGDGRVLQVTVSESDDTITLATATEGASIYYTTDGTYPTPTNGTLYTAPIVGPTIGETWRVAAYKTGLNPSDVLQFTIAIPENTVTDGNVILTDVDGSILTDN